MLEEHCLVHVPQYIRPITLQDKTHMDVCCLLVSGGGRPVCVGDNEETFDENLLEEAIKVEIPYRKFSEESIEEFEEKLRN